MKTFLILIFALNSISSNAQFLGKSYKETIDFLYNNSQYQDFTIKDKKGKVTITIEEDRIDVFLIKALIEFYDDTCRKTVRLYSNDRLNFYLDAFQINKSLGKDIWQDFDHENISWAIVRHKDTFDIVISYRNTEKNSN